MANIVCAVALSSRDAEYGGYARLRSLSMRTSVQDSSRASSLGRETKIMLMGRERMAREIRVQSRHV
jgi:hypothetical protein